MSEQQSEDHCLTDDSIDLFLQQENERNARELNVSVEYYILEFT